MTNKEILFYFSLMLLFVVAVIYFTSGMVAKALIENGQADVINLQTLPSYNPPPRTEQKKN